jgi:hypothetical protein
VIAAHKAALPPPATSTSYVLVRSGIRSPPLSSYEWLRDRARHANPAVEFE